MLTSKTAFMSTLLCGAILAAGLLAPTAEARTITTKEVMSAALEGNNVYYSTISRAGIMSLSRIDVGTGAAGVIYTAPNARTLINRIAGGGGRVAIGTISFGKTRVTTSVKTAAPDGTGLADLTTAQIDLENDCGQVSTLLDVASNGEVFVGNVARNRTGVACASGSEGDATSAQGNAISGAQRTVFASSGPINDRQLIQTVITGGDVNGDNLLLGTLRQAHAIDLPSGARATYPASLKGSVITSGSIHADGRVLLNELKAKEKRKRLKNKKGSKKKRYRKYVVGQSSIAMYERKLDPTSGRQIFSSTRSAAVARFCGDRILRGSGPLQALGLLLFNISETDGLGRVLRGITPGPQFFSDSLYACDASNALIGGFDASTRKPKPALDLTPLG